MLSQTSAHFLLFRVKSLFALSAQLRISVVGNSSTIIRPAWYVFFKIFPEIFSRRLFYQQIINSNPADDPRDYFLSRELHMQFPSYETQAPLFCLSGHSGGVRKEFFFSTLVGLEQPLFIFDPSTNISLSARALISGLSRVSCHIGQGSRQY